MVRLNSVIPGIYLTPCSNALYSTCSTLHANKAVVEKMSGLRTSPTLDTQLHIWLVQKQYKAPPVCYHNQNLTKATRRSKVRVNWQRRAEFLVTHFKYERKSKATEYF
jgi:hypothetical protein